jgi:hypothetical protein
MCVIGRQRRPGRGIGNDFGSIGTDRLHDLPAVRGQPD